MSDNKKCLSGHQKRKKKKDNEQVENNDIKRNII
jgi:hypothetical protein